MTNEKTKALVKNLSLLSDNNFIILAADFETGQVTAIVPGFEDIAKKTDPKALDKTYGMTVAEMDKVRSGNIIDAIKMIRERAGLTLADAKAICERFREAHRRGEVACA